MTAESPRDMVFEVEMKFRVPSLAVLRTRLETLGAVLHDLAVEQDLYFNHPQRDFAQTDEALRVRRSNDDVCITYKGPKLDQTTKTREELEIALAGDSDSAQRCSALLELLGFRPVATVRKHRARYIIQRGEQPIEVTLDDVDEVGTFAELEIRSDADGMEIAKTLLHELASELGLGDGERRSYLQLLLLARGI